MEGYLFSQKWHILGKRLDLGVVHPRTSELSTKAFFFIEILDILQMQPSIDLTVDQPISICNEIAPCKDSKTVMYSGFHAVDSGLQVLDSSLCQWDTGILVDTGF